MMQIYSRHLDEFQSAILSLEYHKSVGLTCICGQGKALYRCEDCFQEDMHCADCLVKLHVHAPFHHFLEWKGAHFSRTSYGQLNGVLALGHCGEKCPNRSCSSQGRSTVIVHANGIHTMRVEYCRCLDAPMEHIQLTRARLFPASIAQPATVFTFKALDEFHQHSLTSKKAAYDYYDALRKLTSSTFPQDVPVSNSLLW